MTMKAIFFALLPAVATVVYVNSKTAPLKAPMPPIGPEIQMTCANLEATARALRSAGGDGTFAYMLTDSCLGATASVEHRAGARELARAWVLLRSLAEFRRTILAMNAASLRDAAAHPGAPVSMVSETGAYLIAREMGLLDRRDDWLRAAADAEKMAQR